MSVIRHEVANRLVLPSIKTNASSVQRKATRFASLLKNEKQTEKFHDLSRIYLPKKRRLFLELQIRKSTRKSHTFNAFSEKLLKQSKEQFDSFSNNTFKNITLEDAEEEYELEGIINKTNNNIANLYSEINSYLKNYKDTSIITQMNFEADKRSLLNTKHLLKFKCKNVTSI